MSLSDKIHIRSNEYIATDITLPYHSQPPLTANANPRGQIITRFHDEMETGQLILGA